MNRWWRAYDEAVDDPKLILLSDKAHRSWFNLMCIASLHGGILPDIKIVAVKLRLTVQRAAAAIAELVQAGLFDRREDGSFEPHNWSARQYKSDVTDPTNATRQKRYRDRHRNEQDTVTDTVTVTPPREQNTETDNRTEKKTRVNALPPPWNEGDFNEFWLMFPNKIGKAAAEKAFRNAVKKIEPKEFFPALQRYATKTDDRPFCNPATWLNQERWLDQPAANVVRPQVRNGGAQGFESLFQSEGKPDDTAARAEYDIDLTTDRPH